MIVRIFCYVADIYMTDKIVIFKKQFNTLFDDIKLHYAKLFKEKAFQVG